MAELRSFCTSSSVSVPRSCASGGNSSASIDQLGFREQPCVPPAGQVLRKLEVGEVVRVLEGPEIDQDPVFTLSLARLGSFNRGVDVLAMKAPPFEASSVRAR